jgi:plastocyanin
MIHRTPLAAALVALALAVSACGGTSGASSDAEDTTTTVAAGPDLTDVTFEDATDATTVEVQARDNSFEPQFVEVKAGTSVTFTNVGRTEHNVYPAVDGAFAPVDATDLEPDEAATITFDEPGDVPYYCTLHGTTTKGMVGAIRVVP